MRDGDGDTHELGIRELRHFLAESLFLKGIGHLLPEGFTEVSSRVMKDGSVEVLISDGTGRTFVTTVKVEEVVVVPIK